MMQQSGGRHERQHQLRVPERSNNEQPERRAWIERPSAPAKKRDERGGEVERDQYRGQPCVAGEGDDGTPRDDEV